MSLEIRGACGTLIRTFRHLLLRGRFRDVSMARVYSTTVVHHPAFCGRFLSGCSFVAFFVGRGVGGVFSFTVRGSGSRNISFFVVIFRRLLSRFSGLLRLVFDVRAGKGDVFRLRDMQRCKGDVLGGCMGGRSASGRLPLRLDCGKRVVVNVAVRSVF